MLCRLSLRRSPGEPWRLPRLLQRPPAAGSGPPWRSTCRRWETDDQEVIAVWEYDDMAAYERIDAAVRADPESVKAQKQRSTLGPLFTERHETFARSTVRGTGGR